MAMVTITNGRVFMKVAKGTFNEIYKRQGFRVAGTEEIEKAENKVNEDINTKEENTPDGTQENENTNDNLANEDEDMTEDDEKSLEEKTLKEMSLEELKEYAKLNNVDVEGLTEKKEIRKAIKAAMNN